MVISQKNILRIALEQSAYDANCKAGDFLKTENVVTVSKENKLARRYLALPHICNLISYGNNVVATVSEEYRDIVTDYINKYPAEHCFETPNMHVLDDAFAKYGCRVCFMAEYYLPDLSVLKPLDCRYETRLLGPEDFKDLYTGEWSNALCKDRKELDVLGIGAYDKGNLIGLAACSADCDTMWQIGVDVKEEYRRKGIASALTSSLAVEILRRAKVPFYCSAWSNIKSVGNALKSGFKPAWVEMTVKPSETVDKFNSVQKTI